MVVQGGAEIVEDLDGVRLQGGRPLKMGHRLVRPSEVLAEVAEIVERVDQIRFEIERAAVAGRGFVAPAGVSHHVAEVVVKLGNAVVGRDRLTDLPDRDLGMPLAVRQESEHMKAASVVRIDCGSRPEPEQRSRRKVACAMASFWSRSMFSPRAGATLKGPHYRRSGFGSRAVSSGSG